MKKTTKFSWREKEMNISQCITCRHWVRGGVCRAFPNGVPDVILSNEVSHKKPYRGDGGIQYEPLV
jgi:hypothetical protein